MKTIVIIVLLLLVIMPTTGVTATGKEESAVMAQIVEGNCKSLSTFAKRAENDRWHVPFRDALSYYHKTLERNLEESGETPVVSPGWKDMVYAVAQFMYGDKERGVQDYMRACLLNESGASPPWYVKYVKKYGVPPEARIAARRIEVTTR